MRQVILVFASDPVTLAEKVNKKFMQAEKEGIKIISTHYIYGHYDKYCTYIEYEDKQGAK